MNPTSKIHPLRQLITLMKFLWSFTAINWQSVAKISLVLSLLLLIYANITGNIDFIMGALMYFVFSFFICTVLAFIEQWKFNRKHSSR